MIIMKRTKKIFAAVSAVIVVLAFTACNINTGGSKTTKPTSVSQMQTNPYSSSELPSQEQNTEAETTPTQAVQTEPDDFTEPDEETLPEINLEYNEDIPDITGSWQAKSGESVASGNTLSLYDIYGTGARYGGTLSLNADGTFYISVGINADNGNNRGEYSVDQSGIHVTYESGKTDTYYYISDFDGASAIKARQGDYYIYFVR